MITPAMPGDQVQNIYDAVEASGAKWCLGEPLVLTGLPNAPVIATALSSLQGSVQLLLTLRGQLRSKRVPGRVKLLCKSR
jgi:hypothetical protein